MTLASAPTAALPTSSPSASTSSALSIFSPNTTGPRTEFANSDLNALIANAMSSSLTNYDNAVAAAAAAAAASANNNNNADQANKSNNADAAAAAAATTNGTAHMDFIDDDLPLLSDSETYHFGEGEEVRTVHASVSCCA